MSSVQRIFRRRNAAAARLRPLAAAVLLAIAPVHALVAAEPAASAELRNYRIDAGALTAALNRFAQHADLILSFDPKLTEGKKTAGIDGEYAVADGLEALLAGTGLQAVNSAGNAWSLRVAPVGADTLLAPVRVIDDAENAYGPVHAYVAKRSATGTKTDTPLIETPQSISVVTAAQMEVLRPQSLMETLNYTAGVFANPGPDHTIDAFSVRGFGADASYGSLYRDGSKYQVNAFNGQQEPYGLERIEVLKGAASVLYGATAPGGIINTVSKRPMNAPLRELNVDVGNFDRRQISGDFSDSLDADQVWAYRLTFLRRESDTYVDYVADDREYVAPVVEWRPSEATSLTLRGEYQHDETAYMDGLPAAGTIDPNPNGKISRHRFTGEPDYDEYDNKRYSIGYLFEHEFNDAFKLRHSLNYMHSQNDMPSVWTAGLADGMRTTEIRGSQDREDESSAVTSDSTLQYLWSSGVIAHTSLVGVDYTVQHHQSDRRNRDAQPLDLFDPVYGLPLSEPYSDYSWRFHTQRLGLYVQDQMKIAEKWVLLLGGRQDWVRYSEAIDPIGSPRNWDPDGERTDAFTGRAGLVYLADNGLAPFASFSQSFEPLSGRSSDGGRLDPTRGEQYELGLRYQPIGAAALFSATVYQLTQEDVGVTDPANRDFQVQLGEVRSRGLELEANTPVGDYANIIAAYTYTDARTLESGPLTPEDDGTRTGAIPYNQFSLWGDYSFGDFGLAALKAGLGIRYVDSTVGIWMDAEVPSFTLLDAMLSYGVGPWRLALNVTNVTDKTYVATCTYACFYGEPRRVTASVGYSW
jgi:iron complex outermembrane receptor protein